jgi:glucan biosynthesis protein C
VQPKQRSYFLDYLKGIVVAIVVAHHSMVAYATFAKYNMQNYVFSTAPIVDQARWIGFDYIQRYNDIFFMSMMFFVSGIFFYSSYAKRGFRHFAYAKFKRLIVPFIVLVTIVIPIAYYPSYLVTGNEGSYLDFYLNTYFSNYWIPGPPWFLWVLFAYSILTAIVMCICPNLLGKLSNALEKEIERPYKVTLIFVIINVVSFVIPYYLIPSGNLNTWWFFFGPFWVETNRFFLYGWAFFAGAILAYPGLKKSAYFQEGNSFAGKWKTFLLLSGLIFFVHAVGMLIPILKPLFPYTLAIDCALACVLFFTFFQSCVNKESRILSSLARNSFAIYMLHYNFVIWIQYAILDYPYSAIIKFLIVFPLALSLSWGTSFFLKKIPVVRDYL